VPFASRRLSLFVLRPTDRRATVSGAVLACLALAGCGGGEDLLLPGDGEPAAIAVVDGNGQSGRVGEPLNHPLVVRVTDNRTRPVAGASVVFDLSSAGPGAASVPDTATTNANGEANARIVLGSRMGAQTGEARVVAAEGSPAPKTAFTVTALSENANGIAALSGDGQTGAAGSRLAQPLVVEVTDAFGNPIAGVTVNWSAEGGGTVSEASVTTDDQGHAAVERTLGPAAGQQTTMASAEGLAGSPVTFVHTATAGNASGLSIVSGNNQTAEAGTQLPADLVVRLVDAEGNGVPGAGVTWVVGTGGGSVTPENGMTDEAGRASAQWTLGATPGQNRVDAVVSGVGVVNFIATGTTAAPAALSVLTQPSSTASNGIPFGRQPVIQVLDTHGNEAPTAGIEVTAQLAGGGGEVVGTTHRRTDASGRATFTDLAISGAEGQRTLVFTASGYAGATSNAIEVRAISTTTTITSDAPDPSLAGATFTVEFRVSSSGPTPTGEVTVTVSDGSPTCTGTLQGGVASCQLTLNQTGDRTLRATYSGAPGLNGSSGTESHRVQAPQPQNKKPHADFHWSCQGLTCHFADNSSDPDGNGTIASWSWDFGDGATGANNTSQEKDPSHDFSAPGTYTVTLIVTDNAGASDTASTRSAKVENRAPRAEFDVSCPNPDLTCTFTDQSRDDDGRIVTWRWDFGDGQFSDLQSPSHTYAADQTYEVKLTVTDNGGASDDKTDDAKPKAAANRPPTAGPVNATTPEDAAIVIPVLASANDPDGDPLTSAIATTPQNGTATVNSDGSVTYSPNPNFSGIDGFTYRVSDGRGGTSDPAAVQVTVTPVNDAPVANNDGPYVTSQDVALVITAAQVLANDTDPENDPRTIAGVSQSLNGGSVNLAGDGSSITYTPPAGFFGDDSFTYTATDGSLSSNVATVTVTVSPASGDGGGGPGQD
jgi:PKD repeat protein